MKQHHHTSLAFLVLKGRVREKEGERARGRMRGRESEVRVSASVKRKNALMQQCCSITGAHGKGTHESQSQEQEAGWEARRDDASLSLSASPALLLHPSIPIVFHSDLLLLTVDRRVIPLQQPPIHSRTPFDLMPSCCCACLPLCAADRRCHSLGCSLVYVWRRTESHLSTAGTV